MGINAIREMFKKNPLFMDEFHTNYIAEFKNYKNKNVAAAARGLINVIREINPKLLHKKYRGKIETN